MNNTWPLCLGGVWGWKEEAAFQKTEIALPGQPFSVLVITKALGVKTGCGSAQIKAKEQIYVLIQRNHIFELVSSTLEQQEYSAHVWASSSLLCMHLPNCR